MLSKKKLPIWDYKSKENKNSSALNISVYKKSFIITKLLIDYCIELKNITNIFLNTNKELNKYDISLLEIIQKVNNDILKIIGIIPRDDI